LTFQKYKINSIALPFVLYLCGNKMPMIFLKYLFSKQFRLQLLFLIVFFVGLFIGLSSWLESTTNHDQRIQVPDLTRMSTDEVEKALSTLNLRYEVIDASTYDPNYPKNTVKAQSPQKDLFVKENRKIYLTLNASKFGNVILFEFEGDPKQEVIAQLKSLGFKIGKIETVLDKGKDVVRILKYKDRNLKAGDKLPKRSTIDITVGDGKEE
jgi:eukaryotic-like serine/threonine-protein kinase